MQCIITGCALVDETNRRWAWGDLFSATDVGPEHDPQILIHNASVASTQFPEFRHPNEAYWIYAPISDSSRCTLYLTTMSFFNKRGVSVFKAEDCQFNEAAKARILQRT